MNGDKLIGSPAHAAARRSCPSARCSISLLRSASGYIVAQRQVGLAGASSVRPGHDPAGEPRSRRCRRARHPLSSIVPIRTCSRMPMPVVDDDDPVDRRRSCLPEWARESAVGHAVLPEVRQGSRRQSRRRGRAYCRPHRPASQTRMARLARLCPRGSCSAAIRPARRTRYAWWPRWPRRSRRRLKSFHDGDRG